MSWVSTLENDIFTYLKTQLAKKHKNIFVTGDTYTLTNPQLPCVFVDFISFERGADLENKTINAVSMTVEVHIMTEKLNDGYKKSKAIANDVIDLLKAKSFSVTFPNSPVSNTGGVYESVSRFARLIGQGDVLFKKTL